MENPMNRFNLIDEPWIPVAGAGLVSLMQVFSNPNLRALGGNPVQKIALTKLLLAIAQAAATPNDEGEWLALGNEGLATRVRAYLTDKKDCFWLYGERPFLQMREIAGAALQTFGAIDPQIASGNTTILTGSQVEQLPTDQERALLVVQQMGFALGGKKTDNHVVLSAGYLGKTNEKGKASTGKPGPSVGFLGFLHSFVVGPNLYSTLWINLFTNDQLRKMKSYDHGLGPVPWETPPQGEDCQVAKALQRSLMGRLVPVSRFLLLEDSGLRYSEGIIHGNYKDGMVDPTVAADFSGKDPKVLWVDPEKRPWRFLTSLLSFIQTGGKNQFDCVAVRLAVGRVSQVGWPEVGLWSGGLRVSSNAGEQYVSGTDDYVESETLLSTAFLNQTWFDHVKLEMTALDELSKAVFGSSLGYQKALKADGDKLAGQAGSLFWQLAEREFQALVEACNQSPEERMVLRRRFSGYARKAYDTFCPQDTARQLDAWAAHQPQFGNYLA